MNGNECNSKRLGNRSHCYGDMRYDLMAGEGVCPLDRLRETIPKSKPGFEGPPDGKEA